MQPMHRKNAKYPEFSFNSVSLILSAKNLQKKQSRKKLQLHVHMASLTGAKLNHILELTIVSTKLTGTAVPHSALIYITKNH
jgi:hypothetical protein